MQVLVSSLTGNAYPTVGASGGVFGLLLAYGIFFPNRVVMLIFPPVALPIYSDHLVTDGGERATLDTYRDGR